MLGVCLFGFLQAAVVLVASARDQVAPTSQKQWAPAESGGLSRYFAERLAGSVAERRRKWSIAERNTRFPISLTWRSN